jgi:hypothetical protein
MIDLISFSRWKKKERRQVVILSESLFFALESKTTIKSSFSCVKKKRKTEVPFIFFGDKVYRASKLMTTSSMSTSVSWIVTFSMMIVPFSMNCRDCLSFK